MSMRRGVLGAAVAIAFLLLASTVSVPARAQMDPMAGPPLDQLTGDDFDKAFLQQMTMHHAMAVIMARPAVVNAGHQEVKDLAQTIVDDQSKEIAQMRTWAKDWYGLDIPDHVAMMGQMMGQGRGMPGTGQGGTRDQGMPMTPSGGAPMMPGMPMMHDRSMMGDLWKLPSQRLDAVFMAMMIPHHQSAVEMANLVPDRAAHSELKDLAKAIVESQRSEIDTMNGWLSSWYSL